MFVVQSFEQQYTLPPPPLAPPPAAAAAAAAATAAAPVSLHLFASLLEPLYNLLRGPVWSHNQDACPPPLRMALWQQLAAVVTALEAQHPIRHHQDVIMTSAASDEGVFWRDEGHPLLKSVCGGGSGGGGGGR